MQKFAPTLLLLPLLCAPMPAHAQAAEEVLTFSPTGFGLMVAAYLALWLLVAVFVATLLRRQKLATAKLHALHATLDKLTELD